MIDVLQWLVIIVIVGGFLLGIIWMNFSLVKEHSNKSKLKNYGVKTSGKLIDAKLVHTHRGKDYLIQFSYLSVSENGTKQTYKTEQKVDEQLGAQIASTGSLEVQYLKNQTDTVFIVGNQASTQRKFLVILLDVFLVLGLIYYLLK